MTTSPTADDVAHAVIIAAKHVGLEDPSMVATFLYDPGTEVESQVVRTRAYAAMALSAVFEEVHASKIALMVGVLHPITAKSYLSGLRHRIRNKTKTAWWDDNVFLKIVEELDAKVPKTLVQVSPEVYAMLHPDLQKLVRAENE